MKNLVNIAATEEKPFYVDAASITAVHIYPEKDELMAYNATGQVFYINSKSYNVDPDILLQKLAEAGNPLVYFPTRYDDKEYAHYVAPSAVTYATVTHVGKDGTLAAIVGVKGVGREESNATKPEELQALLDGVKAAGRELLEYKPEVAHARYYNAAALYIDPATVTEIREDGCQINVYFEGSGSLDVQTRDYSGKQNDRTSELLNQFWNERRAEFKDLNDCARAASAQAKTEETQARHDIADEIAAANGTLTKIKNVTHAIHINPDNFAYVSFYDSDRKDDAPEYKFIMTLERQKTRDNPYAEGVRAYFNSAAARAEAFEELKTSMAQPSKDTPQPKKQQTSPKP